MYSSDLTRTSISEDSKKGKPLPSIEADEVGINNEICKSP